MLAFFGKGTHPTLKSVATITAGKLCTCKTKCWIHFHVIGARLLNMSSSFMTQPRQQLGAFHCSSTNSWVFLTASVIGPITENVRSGAILIVGTTRVGVLQMCPCNNSIVVWRMCPRNNSSPNAEPTSVMFLLFFFVYLLDYKQGFKWHLMLAASLF